MDAIVRFSMVTLYAWRISKNLGFFCLAASSCSGVWVPFTRAMMSVLRVWTSYTLLRTSGSGPRTPRGWSRCSYPSHQGHQYMPLPQASSMPGVAGRSSFIPVPRTIFFAVFPRSACERGLERRWGEFLERYC
ncbi:hypothetical protein VTN96DRAFT_10061 [Rasamsonia emersonii]